MQDYVDSTNEGFEFLITHPDDLSMDNETFDSLMTPDDEIWIKIEKENWIFYKVGEDEFTYSWEPPGIQMTFSKSFPFEKAQRIATQVVDKLRGRYRQNFELIFVPH